MRVGIDLDGVCYNFTASLKKYMVEFEGFSPEQLKPSTCWDFYSVDWGITLEEYVNYCNKGVDAEIVFLYGKPFEGVLDGFKALKEDGHTLHVITHRQFGSRSTQNTENWLVREGLMKYIDTLTFSKDKTVVPVDIFVEDNVENARAISAAGSRAVLLDRPWNQHGEDIDRVYSFEEFVEVVRLHECVKAVQVNEFETILDEAKHLVYGNRNVDYGHPADDYTRTAQIWSALFGVDITPQQAVLGMIGVKMSRLVNDSKKRDSVVDIAGYAECFSRINRREAGLE